ncbi:hypothetical protein Tco_1145425 [Tanacetum coccineum]
MKVSLEPTRVPKRVVSVGLVPHNVEPENRRRRVGRCRSLGIGMDEKKTGGNPESPSNVNSGARNAAAPVKKPPAVGHCKIRRSGFAACKHPMQNPDMVAISTNRLSGLPDRIRDKRIGIGRYVLVRSKKAESRPF